MTKPPRRREREVRVSDANEAGSWDGILGPGEAIEWQGAPVQGLMWEYDRLKTLAGVALAVAGTGLAAYTYGTENQSIGNTVLVFLVWGVIAVVYQHARSFWDRRRTFYTVTNQRAFIANWHFGVQSLRAYPIATMQPLRLVDTRPGHVWFDKETVPMKDRSTNSWKEEIVEVGFQNLSDPRLVHDLLVGHGAVKG